MLKSRLRKFWQNLFIKKKTLNYSDILKAELDKTPLHDLYMMTEEWSLIAPYHRNYQPAKQNMQR